MWFYSGKQHDSEIRTVFLDIEGRMSSSSNVFNLRDVYYPCGQSDYFRSIEKFLEMSHTVILVGEFITSAMYV